MGDTTPTEVITPRHLSVTLTGETPEARGDEIAEAVHQFVTVYRDPPRFLVMHPADYAEVAPFLKNERSMTERDDDVANRVFGELDRGAILLSDTEGDEWETPDGA